MPWGHVLEGRSLDVIFHVAIFESSFEDNELPFLEGFGELREIPPGIDSVDFFLNGVFRYGLDPNVFGRLCRRFWKMGRMG
jgi:hypothetical protein